jgi:hypothetical protein
MAEEGTLMRLGREIIDLGNVENDSNAIYFEGRDDSSIYAGLWRRAGRSH